MILFACSFVNSVYSSLFINIAIMQMISLYRDPEGENVLTQTGGNTLSMNEKNLNFVSDKVTTHMRERIVELETLLKKCHCQVC